MAEKSNTATVLDVRRNPSFDVTRLGKWDRIVTYQDDTGAKYALFLPDETFNDAALTAAIKADVQEHAKWTGKTISL